MLIEFQSRVDKYMALRVMVYVGLLYQDLIKRGEVLADGRLPPVLFIVLYNGSQRWSAVSDVCDLIPPVPGLVEQFKPRLKHLLIDENAYKAEGKADAKAEGEALALQKLLRKRFGAVPSEVLATIASASLEQLDTWLDQVLDARSLDELFGPTTH